LVLALETSTRNCSVALIQDKELIGIKEEHADQYIHSEKLHLFIQELLETHNYKASQLSAIAVGAGPGSYTGLRIGVASAKALAYSLSIPLISAKGTELLKEGLLQRESLAPESIIHPMIDARRMEVYTAAYSVGENSWNEVQALVLEEGQFKENVPHYFIGDGAAKAQQLFQGQNHFFPDLVFPSAAHFSQLAEAKLKGGETEDVAYFEPFYLKEFEAHKPKSLF